MSNVITLVFPSARKAKAWRVSRRRVPVDILTQAAAERARVGGSVQNLDRFPVLSMLAWLAKIAPDRARSINYGGVRFPLLHGLCMRVVVCPRTGRQLVATVTL